MKMGKIKCTAIFSAVLLLLLLSALSCLPISADGAMPKFSEKIGEAFVLYDLTHEKYVIEEGGFNLVPTSTSAKITMGLIACEMLADRLDEKVEITDAMIDGVPGSKWGLELGEKISIRDLLYLAICGTRNDAAYALSVVCAGSSHAFVEMMNLKAKELGANNTNYVNPLGYPDDSAMLTTAYDVLKIARAASENQLYMEISSAASYKISETNKSAAATVYNRNLLIRKDPNSEFDYTDRRCLGMNAGMSGDAGGWSIVTLIRDTDEDGSVVDYIAVLLGGKENPENENQIYAYDYVDQLATYVYKNYNYFTIKAKGTEMGKTAVALTMVIDAKYVLAEDLKIYITDRIDKNNISYHVELNEDITAPVKAGEVIGRVVVTSGGKKIGFGDLTFTEDYEPNAVMRGIDFVGSYTKSRAFIITAISFVLLLGGYFGYKYFTRYSSKGRYTRKR